MLSSKLVKISFVLPIGRRAGLLLTIACCILSNTLLSGCLAPQNIAMPRVGTIDPRIEKRRLEYRNPFAHADMGPEVFAGSPNLSQPRPFARRSSEKYMRVQPHMPRSQTYPGTTYPGRTYPGQVAPSYQQRQQLPAVPLQSPANPRYPLSVPY